MSSARTNQFLEVTNTKYKIQNLKKILKCKRLWQIVTDNTRVLAHHDQTFSVKTYLNVI